MSSLAFPVRSLGARRTLLVQTRSIHSPFPAKAPHSAPTTHTHTQEPNTRLHVVAGAPADKFNGVPLGAYPISTPYHNSSEGSKTQEMSAKEVRK